MSTPSSDPKGSDGKHDFVIRGEGGGWHVFYDFFIVMIYQMCLFQHEGFARPEMITLAVFVKLISIKKTGLYSVYFTYKIIPPPLLGGSFFPTIYKR